MSNAFERGTDSSGPMSYQIRLKGHLNREWTDWFGGLTIILQEDGETLLTGPVTDQAALYGLIKKMRDLGMFLVSVNRLEPDPVDANCSTKEQKMNIGQETTGMDIKVKLSMLWIFVLLNMAYADILSLMDSVSPIRKVMEGASLPAGGLLAGAILMETAIAMVILSRVLKPGANRWANIIIAAINIAAVITGGRGLYYAFFATVEVVCMLFIIGYAWKWPTPTPDSWSSSFDKGDRE